MGWISQHKMAFGIVIAALVAGSFYVLSQDAGAPTELLAPTDMNGVPLTSGSADQEIVATLLALHAVSLNSTILQDPAFMTLKDFGTEIIAEPIGRSNPFAPLGARGTGAASSTRTTTPTAR